ncbi:hypothetical protein ACHQM5_016426 [Ranunculus cassubicifolius]
MNSSISYWDYTILLLLRPLAAIIFVLLLILLGWLFAWKLVLVHVPLVQEICKSFKKKPKKAKPPKRRFSNFYNTVDANKMASN